MKKKLFNGKTSKIILAFFCLVLAIILWYFVKYNVIDSLLAFSSDIG